MTKKLMKEKTNGRMRIELMIDKMIKGKSKFCNLIFGKIVPIFGIPKIRNQIKVENFGIPAI